MWPFKAKKTKISYDLVKKMFDTVIFPYQGLSPENQKIITQNIIGISRFETKGVYGTKDCGYSRGTVIFYITGEKNFTLAMGTSNHYDIFVGLLVDGENGHEKFTSDERDFFLEEFPFLVELLKLSKKIKELQVMEKSDKHDRFHQSTFLLNQTIEKNTQEQRIKCLGLDEETTEKIKQLIETSKNLEKIKD